MKVDVVRGASAGAVGVWAMDVATWALYRRQSPETLRREGRVRPFGKDPAHAAAERLRRSVGARTVEEPNGAGILIHYQLGMAPAVAYVHLRRRWPWIRAGRGALYGALLFVANDEIAARALGIAGPQRAYPWQTHLRGLVGHVVLGVVTELVLDVLEAQPPADASRREAAPA